MRVLALVGAYRADLEDHRHRDSIKPLVAAVLPDYTWDVMPDEDVLRHWAAAKEMYDPGAHQGYEWREIWLTLDAASLRAHFDSPSVAAEVEPASSLKRSDA